MPGLTLSFFALVAAATHAGAAIAFGSYFCGSNDDDPIHDSHHSSSSHNRRSTRIQTQPPYRPPPLPPSHTYRSPETYSQTTTPRTPAPPDPGRGVYYPSLVSPYTRTPSQTQPSASIRPSIAQYTSTSSRASVPPCVPTERDPLLHTVIRGVSRSNVVSPSTRTPSQTQPSAIRTQPYSTSTLTQPSSTRVQPSPSLIQPSTTRTQPSFTVTQPSSTFTQPTSTRTQPTSTLTQASCQHSSLLNTVHVNETSSHVPSGAHTRSEPPPPTVIQVISSDVEDLDFAKKLRELAQRRRQKMSEERSREKRAKEMGNLAAARYHKEQAIVHKKEMKELDQRAAKIIFREKNKVGRWMDTL